MYDRHHENAVRVTALVAILIAAAATTATGQGGRYQGYWGNLGLGAGARVVSGAGETETTGGGAMILRMGGKVSDLLLLGGEIGGWGREENQVFVAQRGRH